MSKGRQQITDQATKTGPTAPTVAKGRKLRSLSLPPASDLSPLPPGMKEPQLTERELESRKPKYKKIAKSSKIRQMVHAILTLELDGKSKEDIAAALGIAEKTITQYKWLAGQNGWLPRVNPKDTLQFELSHKVVNNLSELLDSKDEKMKAKVTLKVAEGTLFKEFDPQLAQPLQSNTVIAVRVEMPSQLMGQERPQVRDGAVGGTPRYIDAVVEETRDVPAIRQLEPAQADRRAERPVGV